MSARHALFVPALVLIASLPTATLAQGAPLPAAPQSAEQAIIDMQLSARPTTPPPGLSGAEAGAIDQHYLAGIGKDRSPFSDSSSGSNSAGYGGASTVGQ